MQSDADPSFRSLLSINLLTSAGGMVGQSVLYWWMVHAGSAVDVAICALLSAGASILTLPLLAPIGDRYPKRYVIAFGLAMLAVQGMLLAVFVQHFEYQLSVIVVLGALGVAANSLVLPAADAMGSEILSQANVERGLRQLKTAMAVGRLLGPIAVSGLLVLATAGAALWVYAGLMLLAAAIAARMRRSDPSPETAPPSWVRSLRAGLAAKWRIPLERWLTGLSFLSLLFLLPGIGFLVPVKVAEEQLSPVWLGVFEGAFAAGLLIGASLVSPTLSRRFGAFATNLGAFVLIALAFTGVGLQASPIATAAMFVLIGCMVVCIQLTGQVPRTLATPVSYRTRFAATHLLSTQCAATLGPAVAGVTLVHFQVGGTYLILGVAMLAIAALVYSLPGYRELLGARVEDLDGFYIKRWPAAFDTSGIKDSVSNRNETS